jgi:hypothetical protein
MHPWVGLPDGIEHIGWAPLSDKIAMGVGCAWPVSIVSARFVETRRTAANPKGGGCAQKAAFV